MRQRSAALSDWEQQESAVLEQVDGILRRYPRQAALDYGSGLGRLARRYAAIFRQVTSYEPDAGRARQQRESMAGSADADRIRLVSDVADVGDGYDAVVCSHVIQHVATPTAGDILQDIALRIHPGGHLLLVTTLSPHSSDMFVVDRIAEDGAVVEDEVSWAGFNSTAEAGTQGVLPVRFFSFDDLVSVLAKLGMDLVSAFGFHGGAGVVGPLGAATPELLQCRDVAILGRLRE
jgi:cyclopropane fatty-acyl-phospholipid synthase-like methyltransferase